mmetsp:Transcript_114071/g.317543  ORF Transcript_114071/g.317543 Transcript_114071/m.317543 type:complete len:207 (-) Transcript_114071:455-1075(-)
MRSMGTLFMYEIREREACSHVVTLLSIRKVWKLSRQMTMRKNSAMSRRPTSRKALGSMMEMPCTPSLKNTASSMHWNVKNQKKITRLFSPTHVPTQGQWWSWVRTQRPQSTQCFVRSGWYKRQRLHHRSSWPHCVGTSPSQPPPAALAPSSAPPGAPRRFWMPPASPAPGSALWAAARAMPSSTSPPCCDTGGASSMACMPPLSPS